MTDDEEWEKQRMRAINAAFRTGRPVFADSEGELRYADGDKEAVSEEDCTPISIPPRAVAKSTWWQRLKERWRNS